MTPSAARGLLEAVLWKPAIRWRILRIHVLKPIRFLSFRRNEVNRKATNPPTSLVREGGAPPALFSDEDRAQRNTVALRDVDYVVEASFEMTKRAGREDNVAKFVDMFSRRVERGQHFHQPYLGCREFAAEVMGADDAPQAEPVSCELGPILWDIEFAHEGNRPIFFDARLEGGVLEVPEAPAGSLETSISQTGGTP
jgi:CRISPR-associated protein Cas5d